MQAHVSPPDVSYRSAMLLLTVTHSHWSPLNLPFCLQTPGACVHWYGKRETSFLRKLGHITIVGRSPQECRDRLGLLDPALAAALQPAESSQHGLGSSPQQPSAPITEASPSFHLDTLSPISELSSRTGGRMMPPGQDPGLVISELHFNHAMANA